MATFLQMKRSRDLLQGLDAWFLNPSESTTALDFVLLDDEQAMVLRERIPADFPKDDLFTLLRTSESALEVCNKIWSQPNNNQVFLCRG
jgi:hypothetical protein